MRASLSCSATVTSAVTSPLCLATSALKPRIISRTANRRRFAATTRRKFAAMPLDAGLVEDGDERLGLLVGGEHRASAPGASGPGSTPTIASNDARSDFTWSTALLSSASSNSAVA